MLHGLCGTPMEMGSIPKVAKDADFAVYHAEINNYSASLCNPNKDPSWEEWRDEVDGLVSELLEKHESVSLCGLSMGATLALAVAEGRNDIVSVVALSPLLRYDGWAIKWYQSLLIIPYLLGIKNWSYKESEPFGIRNIELRRRVMRAMEKDGVSQVGAAQIPARHLFAAQNMMRFVRNRLANVVADLMVIHAIDDETAAPRNSEIIIDGVSSEVRKSIWLGDCYHIITVDNEREIVANETVRFLQRSTSSHENNLDYQRSFKRSALKDRR